MLSQDHDWLCPVFVVPILNVFSGKTSPQYFATSHQLADMPYSKNFTFFVQDEDGNVVPTNLTVGQANPRLAGLDRTLGRRLYNSNNQFGAGLQFDDDGGMNGFGITDRALTSGSIRNLVRVANAFHGWKKVGGLNYS
jgi:hypothetical protein